MTPASTAAEPTRTRAELRALLEEYIRTRDPDLQRQLVDAHQGLVHFLARKFANRGEPLDDIVQVGFIGLLKALERFDTGFDTEFTTFATPTIVGEIKRYFRDKSWTIRIPRRLQENYQQVTRVTEELRRETMRQPTIAEIAARMGTGQETVLEALEASPAHSPQSLDASLRSDNGEGRLVADVYGAEDAGLDRVELQDLLERSMRHLSPRERAIMALRFFDELPQSEVARRLGISQMHVSRLQRAALDRLRADLVTAGVEDGERGAIAEPTPRDG